MQSLKFALKVKLSLINPYMILSQHKLLQLGQPITARLLGKKQANYDSYFLRYELPDASKCLGLVIGQAVELELKGKKRKYVPISSIDKPGICDFLVRDMSKAAGTNSFSAQLLAAKEGDQITITGPYTQFLYEGYGKLTYKQKTKTYKNIAMIVYETGITTVYSLISSIEKFLDNRTGITLLWISKKPEDFMLIDQVSDMASKYKINATLLLEQPDKKWLGPHGEVTKEVIQDYFPQPSDTAVILSGSIDQVHALETLLTELGYNDLILPLFS